MSENKKINLSIVLILLSYVAVVLCSIFTLPTHVLKDYFWIYIITSCFMAFILIYIKFFDSFMKFSLKITGNRYFSNMPVLKPSGYFMARSTWPVCALIVLTFFAAVIMNIIYYA